MITKSTIKQELDVLLSRCYNLQIQKIQRLEKPLNFMETSIIRTKSNLSNRPSDLAVVKSILDKWKDFITWLEKWCKQSVDKAWNEKRNLLENLAKILLKSDNTPFVIKNSEFAIITSKDNECVLLGIENIVTDDIRTWCTLAHEFAHRIIPGNIQEQIQLFSPILSKNKNQEIEYKVAISMWNGTHIGSNCGWMGELLCDFWACNKAGVGVLIGFSLLQNDDRNIASRTHPADSLRLVMIEKYLIKIGYQRNQVPLQARISDLKPKLQMSDIQYQSDNFMNAFYDDEILDGVIDFLAVLLKSTTSNRIEIQNALASVVNLKPLGNDVLVDIAASSLAINDNSSLENDILKALISTYC